MARCVAVLIAMVVIAVPFGNASARAATVPVSGRLAFTTGHDAVAVLDVATKEHRVLVQAGSRTITSRDWVYDPTWSPGGDEVAYTRVTGMVEPEISSVEIVDVETRKVRAVVSMPGVSMTAATWSPRGDSIAFVVTSPYLPIWGLPIAHSEVHVVATDGTGHRPLGPGTGPQWSPDGTSIAYESAAGIVVAAADDPVQMPRVVSPPSFGGGVGYPRWSPDGGRIAYLSFSGFGPPQVLVSEVETGTAEFLEAWTYSPPTWSPDGVWLAIEDRGIVKMRSTGGGIQRLTFSERSEDHWPSWAPTGSTIAFARSSSIVGVDADSRETRDLGSVGADPWLAWAPATSGGTPASTSSFYFAEGTTREGFTEELDLANTTGTPGVARVTYAFADGSQPVSRDYAVDSQHTLGVNVNAEVGPDRDVSMKVETPMGWVAERVMFFTANGWSGGHDQVGASVPASVWRFAEGTTLPGFSMFLTLQNPGDRAATVIIAYLTESCIGGGNVTRALHLEAHSRLTVQVADPDDPSGLGSVCTGVSAIVRTTNGVAIVAERPLYFIHDFGAGVADDGHVVFGVPDPSKEWYFAEGTSLPGFFEFLALANPGDHPATVTLRYQTQGQGSPSRQVSVPPRKRVTVQVYNDGDPGGIGPGRVGVSMHLTSDQPVLAERPLYMVHDFGQGVVVTGGHAAQGALAPATSFAFASGSTAPGFAQYLTIQNPGQHQAQLTITYLGPSGVLGTRTVSEPATSRLTIAVHENTGAGLGPGHPGPVGIVIASTQPVLVERPIYFNTNGWSGASNAVGARIDV